MINQTGFNPEVKLLPDDVIYFSGPMSGYVNNNNPAFYAAEVAVVLKYGPVKSFNPALISDAFPFWDYETYMAVDLALVARSSVIVLLNGWENSKGALRELEKANEHGLRVYTLSYLIN